MGRRKSNNPSGLIILGILALIFFTFLIGLWIIFGWIYSEVRYRNIKAAKGRDFELSNDEIQYLEEIRADKSETEENICRILEDGKDLSRRQDGYFSEKSNMGKELNKKLEPIIQDGNHYENKIKEIVRRPLRKFNSWRELRIKKLTYRNTFYIYILSNMFFFVLIPDYLEKIGQFFQQFSGLFLPVVDNELMGLLVTSSWFSFISFWVVKAYMLRNLGNEIKLHKY